MSPYVVALTGASGVVYGIRLVKVLTELGHSLHLIISQKASLVIREELGVSPEHLTSVENLTDLLGPQIRNRVTLHPGDDLTAPVASGSFPTAGMVIMPCSMGTLAAIAGGLSQNLIHRAADCALKEKRKLVLVPRETPLSAIHLENMLKLARLGVAIVPAMPGFYSGAKSIEGLVDFVVGKVLDQLGLSHFLYPRWTGKTQGSSFCEER